MGALYDAPPDDAFMLNGPAFDRAAHGLNVLLARLVSEQMSELMVRARKPRGQRAPWPAVDGRTREEQYLVGIALDCAAVADLTIVRAVMARYVLEVRLGPRPAPTFQPDDGVRRRLIEKAAMADARVAANEKVN